MIHSPTLNYIFLQPWNIHSYLNLWTTPFFITLLGHSFQPVDVPKLNGKTGKYPTSHITTYHLWCVSNSMLDDSIRLRLFHRTLTRNATIWLTKLPTTYFNDFNVLDMAFLTHFQFRIQYEIGTYLLTSLWQNTTTHISDHIPEWRWYRRLVKAKITDQLLADWFIKSLLPKITQDVSMLGSIIEEHLICHSQHLDIIHSQANTLCNINPHSPWTSNDKRPPPSRHHANDVVGSVSSIAKNQLASHIRKMNVSDNPTTTTTTSTTPSTQTSEVNMVQSSMPKNSQQPRGKKMKNWNKKNTYSKKNGQKT